MLTIPGMADAQIADWRRSHLGGAALDAAFGYRYDEALRLAALALEADPDDQVAWLAVHVAADETGDTAAALAAAERLSKEGAASARLVQLGSLAWALLRAREAGNAPEDWHLRARAALDEAADLGGQLWQLDSSRALLSVLRGRPTDAEHQLEAPLREAVHPEERASVLLTLARIRHAMRDVDGAQQLVGEAARLWPSSPRLRDVQRRLDGN